MFMVKILGEEKDNRRETEKPKLMGGSAERYKKSKHGILHTILSCCLILLPYFSVAQLF